MALKPTIVLRQRQKLAVTQKMQQSLAILGMSNTELVKFLEQEEINNPLIRLTSPNSGLNSGSADPGKIAEETLVWRETIFHSVSRQLAATDMPEHLKKPCAIIQGNLTPQGMLDVPLEEMSELSRIPLPHFQAALLIFQQIEPVGIAARSTFEFLTLNLKADGLWSPEYGALLELLESRIKRPDILAVRLGLPLEKVNEMVRLLGRYPFGPITDNPEFVANHVTPDVIFSRSPDGRIIASLNDLAFPKLAPDSAYLDGTLTQTKEVKEYLENRLQRIHWLMRALEKRASTILKIAIAIGEEQHGFFETGPMAMLPMNLQKIASKLGIHESTVSRAISGKFFSCRSGTFPFRYVFSSGITCETGKPLSSTMIRARIAQIIRAENPDKTLSDTKIAEIFAKEGITVARRTIAKYRGAMNVPTSSIRRIQKRAHRRT